MFSKFSAALSRAIEQEADLGKKPLWAFLFFLSGLICYFALPAEPYLIIGPCLFLGGLISYCLARQRTRRWVLFVFLFVSFGFAAGQVRVFLVKAPVVSRPVTRVVEGVIQSISVSIKGRTRLLIQPSHISGWKQEVLPKRVRLSSNSDLSQIRLGDKIRVRARLMAPQGAIVPGGYDFARTAYFQQIGGIGYTLGKPEVLQPTNGWHFFLSLERTRSALKDRFLSSLPASSGGGLAVALLIGDRTYLKEADKEALRRAGLAHILAISGLHLTLFSGVAFLVVRILLSVNRALALSGHVSAIASAFALMAACFYLAISGGAIATQRAFIMVLVVLIAQIVGRKGLTLRSLALSGFIVLLLEPESVLSPGFQMSYIAVLALLSAYQMKLRRKGGGLPAGSRTPARGLLLVPLFWLSGIAATSVIAGIATAPVSLMYFGEMSPLGLLGNLLAMPVFTLVVMPAGVAVFLFSTVGLDPFALYVMGKGLELILFFAYWVSSISGASGLLGHQSQTALLLILLGIVLVCCVPGKFKLVCVIPACLALYAQLQFTPPSLIIAGNGKDFAFFGDGGGLKISSKRKSFTSQTLLRFYGISQEEFPHHKLDAKDVNCDEQGCLYYLKSLEGEKAERSWEVTDSRKMILAHSKAASALEQDCRLAHILVTTFQAPKNCGALYVADAPALKRSGAVALWLTNEEGQVNIAKIKKAYGETRRPWYPVVSE
ncbi:ComEC/Rec2 family competence protein [Flexibacterium corallicola]|uniref:ComEC/Rec2 family competence protein n=1 Tax=Flexibacterium corallicola TaxID=3037259 RepID=UPI00286F91FA|nr:ComEC/Rec2 family competence protein [Pseudovibrio sp. M1P-2-3]